MRLKQGQWLPNGDFITSFGPYQRVTLQGINAQGKVVRSYQEGYDAPNGNLIFDGNMTAGEVKANVEKHYANCIANCIDMTPDQVPVPTPIEPSVDPILGHNSDHEDEEKSEEPIIN